MGVTAGEGAALVLAGIAGSVVTFLVLRQAFPTVFTTIQQVQPTARPVEFNRDGSIGLNLFAENEGHRGPNAAVLI